MALRGDATVAAGQQRRRGGEDWRAGNAASLDIGGIKGGPLSLGSEWPVITECLAT